MDRAGKSDGYCSRIIRAQGTRKEGYNEFRLRVEGDPETYQPGSTYRVTLYASSPSYFRGFTLISVKEGREGDQDEDYAGNFQVEPTTGLPSSGHPTPGLCAVGVRGYASEGVRQVAELGSPVKMEEEIRQKTS
ncbi:spondin-1a [Osmerus mordax]|uniref:spondin-1a n=1 Tax=Osmerus mordax TaxID=8014 RepID=UPI00351026E8